MRVISTIQNRRHLHRPQFMPLVLLTSLFLIVPAIGAGAQQSAGPSPPANEEPAQEERTDAESSEKTIEELYLDSLVSIGKIDAQIRTGGREQQMVALRALKDQIESGAIDPNDPMVIETVGYAVGQGVTRIPSPAGNRLNTYHPLVRRSAAQILSYSDTEEARRILLDIVRYDPEPVVQAEALNSLGSIGNDPDGNITEAIARMLIQETITRRDPTLALSGIIAIETLAKNDNNFISPLAREALVDVAEANYARMIRVRALMAMEELP